MSKFEIDFFELAFLAEACIPPRPIARTSFWQNLTRVYWEQMSDPERAHLFSWLRKHPYYEESLATQDDTKVFHARFDPDNQYTVQYDANGETGERRAFKMYASAEQGYTNRYFVGLNTFIPEEYIVKVTKYEPKTEY